MKFQVGDIVLYSAARPELQHQCIERIVVWASPTSKTVWLDDSASAYDSDRLTLIYRPPSRADVEALREALKVWDAENWPEVDHATVDLADAARKVVGS